ncbi:stabilin-2 [Ambystoma mexicanum]|uniref:stabilin-2 n=1 Tax=Ambystoma mexicanum TaxID=8296 RepID=UPI0037E9875E
MDPKAAALSLVLVLTALATTVPEVKRRCDFKTHITTGTACKSCFVNAKVDCPEGYIKLTNGSGSRDCKYAFDLKTYSVHLPGCRHICYEEAQVPLCCAGYWGPECQDCPGGAATPCNNRGSCADGMKGNGTCSCQEGFGGTACETCAGDALYGADCRSACDCVHGNCNNGINGDGSCDCFSGYRGRKCDQPIPACQAMKCHENARCTDSRAGPLECKCMPGYQGDGRTCEPINPCKKNVCHRTAGECTYLGPNLHRCTCKEGYKGDGTVCLAINPCQENYGGCPTDSTSCKYDGPGKSHCECKKGYKDFTPGVGCSLTDVCATANPCHDNANCTTVSPGKVECTCNKGYVGDGRECYGSILERLQGLNVDVGPWQGKLTSAIALFSAAYAWPLTSLGPFTVLVPANRGLLGSAVQKILLDNEKAKYMAKLHIIAGQLPMSFFNSTPVIYTLTGKSGEVIPGDKKSQRQIRIHGSKKKISILQGDIIASNGLVHIINNAIDDVEATLESNTQETIMTILQKNGRYSRFRSLLQSSDLRLQLESDGPSTVFVPNDRALEEMTDNALEYLLSSQGSTKLQELLKYHVVPSVELAVANVIPWRSIVTMANQLLHFNTTSNGNILVNGLNIVEADVTAKNGRIYTLDGVLCPPSILPVLPHRCDDTKSEIKKGTCVSCSLLHKSTCPTGSLPTELFSRACLYSNTSSMSLLLSYPRVGCSRHCNATTKVPRCCSGFYGPECLQCPGGFSRPCSDNGKCNDGINGDGLCMCNKGFKGTVCQYCYDLDKYGPNCEKKCSCLHGRCDNRIFSDGTCRSGTCNFGYSGKNCDKQTSSCGPLITYCHAHALCDFSRNIPECVCKPGYDGNGVDCVEVNACTSSSNGDVCNSNAQCTQVSVGVHKCVCLQGWTGDGLDCQPINNCLRPDNGGCHGNATCIHIGPSQNDCRCKEGFRGTGFECEPVNTCLTQRDKCHAQATCELTSSGFWDCVCQNDYEGDGTRCYGNAVFVLNSIGEASGFTGWVTAAAPISALLSETKNITVLVPIVEAISVMSQDDRSFWMAKGNLPTLLKYHVLHGVYRIDELQNSTAHLVATSLEGSTLQLSKDNGTFTIQGARIVDGDLPATNGIIHLIDKVLTPIRGSPLPDLLTRLGQMPDYSIFRGYLIQYNLAKEIENSEAYTIFAPNNDALEKYSREKETPSIDEDLVRYHIVLGEQLYKNDLHIGMHRETMLGVSYQVMFTVHGGQLYVNDAPINYTNVATNIGVIHGLTKVIGMQKNRCDTNETTTVTGKCSSCYLPLSCPAGSEYLSKRFTCSYLDYRRGRKVMHLGCQARCAQTIITKACCYGFFGQQCLPCPGKIGAPCFGNGICLDGINSTGVCQCEEGYIGTACEACVPGKYGPACNQECLCVHGRCSEGIDGDGSCNCDAGWRGVHCEREIEDDKCNKSCHTSANCHEKPDGTPYCQCVAGFKGNGSICSAVDACETRNGGCSVYAECKKTTPGNRQCACFPGYTGDGHVCLEFNPCSVNNGGCSLDGECTQTGANQSVCNCLKGYSGDGKICVSINPCRTSVNGGCSSLANCNHTGPGERVCRCRENFVGDGITCRGTIYYELPKNSNTTSFYYKLQSANMMEVGNRGPFTVFVPISDALKNNNKVTDWTVKGLLPQVLRYHIVACTQLLAEELRTMTTVTSLHGDSISITYSKSQNTLYLNNKATIIDSIVASNGIIHVIDQVLTPLNLILSRDSRYSKLNNLTTVAEISGYSMFTKLLQDTDLLQSINDPIHKPVTLFLPSDKAITALPQEQKDFLFNKQNREKLHSVLNFHIVRDQKVLTNDLPMTKTMKTLQGGDVSVRCAEKGNGDMLINDGQCRIVQRQIEFDSGIAYGIDCLLTPASVGGHCDYLVTLAHLGACGYCFNTPSCPKGSKPKGSSQNCQFNNPHFRTINGCQKECAIVMWLPKCCRGYFGKDCQACPGGSESPCNNHGICDDGLAGNGECQCQAGFNGTACELCLPGKYGPDCQTCDCSGHGQCEEGATGTGECTCDYGWSGPRCQYKIDLPPVCSPTCSKDAICKENNTCLCRPFYEGDGITCTVVNRCKENNGGCAPSSKCSQTGLKVSCTCPKGYKGDGYVCLPIDPCADGLNGGCHEHAICTMTGPDKSKCDCKDNYIGDGLDCEVKTLPIDRCSQDNGQCHIDADCADLHYQDSTVGVFHLRSPKGQYKLNYDEANKACASEDAKIASYNQLLYAQKAGYHLCSAGWLDNVRVGYPTAYSSPNCGSGFVGIVDYGTRVNVSEPWDVYCYRVKDVKCTCKVGYVGDGYTCNGNLLQVLTSFPIFSNFLAEILRYSNSSAKGQEFQSYLTNLSIQATLFAPSNDGIGENETLSGRDIEYHLSNVSTIYYEDLTNGSTLLTRIGHMLLITHNTELDPTATKPANLTCIVERRTILQWDYFASNGVIHVISGPLRAPPVPAAAVHPGVGAGIFFIILAVFGLIAFAGYSFYKFNKGHIGFQKFKSNENISVSALDKPSLSNPMYESSTTSTASPPGPSYDAFSESDEQQLVADEPFE